MPVKELFEPIVLQRKGDGFSFFKAFSQEIDLWITLSHFFLKIHKILKRNIYVTKNQFSRDKIFCVEENHSYTWMSYMCAKEFSDLNF